MKLEHDKASGLLQISGDTGILQARELHDALRQCLLDQNHVTVDLAGITTCDTTTLQILLSTQRTAEDYKKAFRVVAISDAVMQNLSTLGLVLRSSAAMSDEQDGAK